MTKLDLEEMKIQCVENLWKKDGLTFEEGLEFGDCYVAIDEYATNEYLSGNIEPIYEDPSADRQYDYDLEDYDDDVIPLGQGDYWEQGRYFYRESIE